MILLVVQKIAEGSYELGWKVRVMIEKNKTTQVVFLLVFEQEGKGEKGQDRREKGIARHVHGLRLEHTPATGGRS